MNLKIRMLNTLQRYPFSLLLLAVIIYLSLFRFETDSLPKITNLDKLAHFLMYAGFCSVVWLEYLLTHSSLNFRKIFWGAIVAPVAFSGAMELAQMFVTDYRSCDFYDFIFNVLGIVAATIFSLYVTRPIIARCKRVE